jgi:uncharacterized membrane protein
MPNLEKKVVCQITKESVNSREAVHVSIIRPSILSLIKMDHPDIKTDGFICRSLLNQYRQKYIERILEQNTGELSKLDKEVVKSVVHHESLIKDINREFDKKLTFGEKLSDKISDFGGSWSFIISFGVIILIWIIINTIVLLQRPFDPYPFILLNLCLSCLAAIQAPVILMSQNRKESKDRLRAENDYKVNLKAELEIRALHEKIDHLTQHQWERLLEIQQMQIDLIGEQEKGLRNRR